MNQQRTPYGIIAVLLMAMGCFCIGKVHGQQAPDLVYEIHFLGPISDAGEKFLTEGLLDQDPMIESWIDPPTRSALARTQVELDRSELQAAIAPSGLMIAYMRLLALHRPDPVERSRSADDFPVYVDTAHPEIDQANYLQAKMTWFVRHGISVEPNPVR